MSKINDISVVKQQYATANNLGTRISIHDKYSTNKLGFGNWIFSNYRIDKGAKVLELGCGTGDMWKDKESVICTCSKIILSDFSEGMVATTKDNIGRLWDAIYEVRKCRPDGFTDLHGLYGIWRCKRRPALLDG